MSRPQPDPTRALEVQARALPPSTVDFRAEASSAADDGAPCAAPSASPQGSAARFVHLRDHAQGGLGKVSIALDRTLKRQVALKEIRPDRLGNEQLRRRFLAEAEITGQLEHPGIVPVYALEEGPRGEPHYAMRFIQGRDLGSAIQAHHRQPTPLAFRELLQRFISVCQTLSYAHSQGVIHRDLKPANIMLGDYGETLVVDWGLAKRLAPGPTSAEPAAAAGAPVPAGETPAEASPSTIDCGEVEGDRLTRAGQALGTPAYMSPEQARGDPEIGPATDIYALGAILYELLAGSPPRLGLPAQVLKQCAANGPILPAAERSRSAAKALSAVCAKALSAAPADRYASAGELAREIERFLADEPTLAYAEPWAARTRRWARKHGKLVAGGIALLSTAVVALAVGAWLLAEANEATSLQRDLALRKSKEASDNSAAEKKRRLQARKALDAMTSALASDLVARQQKLTPELEAFLNSALAQYVEFAADVGDDEETLLGVASANDRLGLIFVSLGRYAEAEKRMRAALAALERLPAGSGESWMRRARIASGKVQLAYLLSRLRRHAEALDLHAQACVAFETIAAERGGDWRAEADLAQALAGLAYARQSLGQWSAADAAYRRARETLERAIAGSADSVKLHRMAGQTCSNHGLVLRDIGNFKAALRAYADGIAHYRQLTAADPTDRQARSELAIAVNNKAITHVDNDEPEKGLELLSESDLLLEPLTKEFPSVSDYRHQLATNAFNRGKALDALDRRSEACDAFRSALAQHDRLARELPEEAGHALEAAKCRLNLACDLRRLGTGRSEAQSLVSAAEATLRALIDRHPSEAGAADYLALTLMERGRQVGGQEELDWISKAVHLLRARLQANVKTRSTLFYLRDAIAAQAESLSRLGRHDDAIAAWKESMSAQLKHLPGTLLNQQLLGMANAYLGKTDHATAATQANLLALGLSLPTSPDLKQAAPINFSLAQIYGRCAALAANDNALRETDRKTQASAYAKKALHHLRAARQGDCFKDADKVKALRTDPAFTALKEDDGFKRLLDEPSRPPPAK